VGVARDAFNSSTANTVPESIKTLVGENACLNRTAYLVTADNLGNNLRRPEIVGNATEGALIIMALAWGFDYEKVHKEMFNHSRDKLFAFNSKKKRSTAIVHMQGGTVRLFCKGAPDWLIKDCTHYSNEQGVILPLTAEKRDEINGYVQRMADAALRTLCLAHRDFKSGNDLPDDWQTSPPDAADLVCDAIVGIEDPLRDDVRDAVRMAQQAGVTVRMVTGDNIRTACAIATQCGILSTDGLALEGPVFRNMTPSEVIISVIASAD
jgi:magnesium-transporting ATPase (P-type)